MVCQLKNRYPLDGHRVLQPLRKELARPVALILTGLFLLASLIFSYAEVNGKRQSEQASGSSFHSLDGHYDLISATVEVRESRNGREWAETFSSSKLDFVYLGQKRYAALLQGAAEPDRLIVTTTLCPALLRNPPFSPRPPPLASIQG